MVKYICSDFDDDDVGCWWLWYWYQYPDVNSENHGGYVIEAIDDDEDKMDRFWSSITRGRCMGDDVIARIMMAMVMKEDVDDDKIR